MNDAERAANRRSPLAVLAGVAPPAPVWFTDALRVTPEERRVTVAGASLETLIWGDVGKPGLIFLHGNGAHAGWWRFVAPFFAADYRVAAFSWSGMGGSDHRPAYTMDGFVDEIFAVAQAAGLGAKPIVVGHSFGGFVATAAAHRQGGGLAGAVIVDTLFQQLGNALLGPPPNATNRPHKPYASLAEALARFRFAPEQSAEHLFIVDLIARGSLAESDGTWSWTFDPYFWEKLDKGNGERIQTSPKCPVALIWGDRSFFYQPEHLASVRGQFPNDTPAIAIPDAAHHVMIDQPLAFVSALRALFTRWPA